MHILLKEHELCLVIWKIRILGFTLEQLGDLNIGEVHLYSSIVLYYGHTILSAHYHI